jgi:hypothetical protein
MSWRILGSAGGHVNGRGLLQLNRTERQVTAQLADGASERSAPARVLSTQWLRFCLFPSLVITFGIGCIVQAETAEPRWVYAGPTLDAEYGGSLSYEFVDVANVRRLNGKVTYWGRKYSDLQLDPIADADPREKARGMRFQSALASGRPPPNIDTALTARILEDALIRAGLPEIETYALIDCRSDRSRTAEAITYLNGTRRESHYSRSERPWKAIQPTSTMAAIEHIVCKPGVAK